MRFITPTDVIEYLRGITSGYRIEGAINRDQLTDNSRLTNPILSIGFGKTTVTDLVDIRVGCNQLVEQQLEITLVTNTGFDDRTGKFAEDFANGPTLQWLFKYLLYKRLQSFIGNQWVENLNHFPTRFISDQPLMMDRARYYHIYVFGIKSQLTPWDGWEPDLGPFASIKVDYNLVGADPETLPNAEDFIQLVT